MKKMRRKDKQTGTEEAVRLLVNGEYGILSTVDNDRQPYGVPLNYVFKGNNIYFHCALTGHKIDNIASNPRVSFCVVGKTKVVPSMFSSDYESAVVFGVASEVGGQERYDALIWLLEKYSPEYIDEGKTHIEKYDDVTKVIKISIDVITGKRAST
ncbi:pyridoxamine 5'-phosphate oxidase family protein [bacterium]|nr:pyridoxamine 5'-phosphate oxidase family protein [candidate division CSSED10-310 bacterium]